MKKIYSHIFMMAALLMAGAAFVSCEKENNPGEYTMTVKAMKGGNGAKALSLDGANISATWTAGDEVQVYNGETLLGTLTAQSAGVTTTLRGDLSGTVAKGDVLTLKFLSPDYSSQKGTLEYIAANCDYAVATVTVTAIDGSNNISTNAPASFQNQQAIFKFTTKNSDGSATIAVKPLTITIGAQDYVITPASATSTLYAALPAISSEAVTFTATGSDSKTYTASKASVTFAAGNYYQSIIKLTEQVPALNLTSPAVGQVIGDDGKNYDYASLPGGVTAVAMICYVSGSNGLALALADEGQMDWSTAISTCAAHTPAFTGGTWKLPSKAEWNQMFGDDADTDIANYMSLNDAISTAGGTALQDGVYWSSTEIVDGIVYEVELDLGSAYWHDDGYEDDNRRVRACLAF